MKKITESYSVTECHTCPPIYDRKPEYQIKWDKDVMVPMRDGVRLCVDVYRPDTLGKFPALLSFSHHNKDLQTPEACENSGPQPSWAPLWLGAQEAGDSKFFVSRGYIHVVGNPRDVGKSDDGPAKQGPPSPNFDHYDLIEWIAAQSWCDGNVGMTGISAFAGQQWQAAMQQPPHLKAIFPYDAYPSYRFRDLNPGGVLSVIGYLLAQLAVEHEKRSVPGPLPPEMEKAWEAAMKNPDYRMYGNLYNVLTQKGQHTSSVFMMLLFPYDSEEVVKNVEANFAKIKIPAYLGAGWYCYTYKGHLQGAQNWYANINVPKKMLFAGLAHMERPFHQIHHEILRWYDYWLKGIDTGIMDEPKVKMWVNGANDWYYGDDWPLPETKWTNLYLQSWERLREKPWAPSSREGIEQPDAFIQMPPTQTRNIAKLRYMTDPLPEDMMVAGPIVLTLYASIDQEDTNWIAILKDVGPDGSVRTAREGENSVPENLPETELSRGWLKASHRALDTTRSKFYKPWHIMTKIAQKFVEPGEINEYKIEILSTANLFKRGHRICIDIASMDMPTGTAGFTSVEYIPYHVCSSKTTVHKIYHDEEHPSYLLLPIIPKEHIK